MHRDVGEPRIIESIRRIPRADRQETRDRYVRVLMALSGESSGVLERGGDFEDDLVRIVRWCKARPRGLHLLVDAIASIEGDSPEVEYLRQLIRLDDPAEHLQPIERQLAAYVMTIADRSAVVTSLTGTLGPLGERLRGTEFDPEQALRLLEDAIPGPNQPHPLYVFLSRLAAIAPPEHADELAALVQTVAERTNADPWSALVPVEPPAPHRYFLVIQLADDARTASRYIVHIWLVTDDGDWNLRYTRDEPHYLEEVKIKLNELLDELANDPGLAIVDLTLEFILPRPLLDQDVEMWEWTVLGEISRIGVDFPVVVRDLQRLRHKLARDRWRRRCESLQLVKVKPTRGSVRIVHFGRDEDREDHSDLLRDPDRPVCLVLSGERAAERVAARLGGWLLAGVPVVAWCRDRRAAARFDANVPELLIDDGVVRLPKGVQQLRQDASGLGFPDGHVGTHITLLWDEERRRPPDDTKLRRP